MKLRLWLIASLAVTAYGWLTPVASAHHATTMFDHSKTVQLEGVVKDQLWASPHSSVTVLVRNSDGTTTEWSVETGSPNINLRHGWRRDSVKVGDHVQMVVYPHRNGGPSGTLIHITLPNGKVLDGASGFVEKEEGASGQDSATSASPTNTTPPPAK